MSDSFGFFNKLDGINVDLDFFFNKLDGQKVVKLFCFNTDKFDNDCDGQFSFEGM